MTLRRLLLILLVIVHVSASPQNKEADTEALGRALEYFQSQKYHEALLIFLRLDQTYQLNARYKAYIGLCCYYDWEYKKAAEYFDTYLPKLGMLSPEELSVYYYADGECHFQLGAYQKAIPLYQSSLAICPERDKGDNWFRLGFCHYFLHQPALAQGCLLVAEYYYATFRNTPDRQARRQQIAHMVRGLRPKLVTQPTPEAFAPPPVRLSLPVVVVPLSPLPTDTMRQAFSPLAEAAFFSPLFLPRIVHLRAQSDDCPLRFGPINGFIEA